MINEYGFTEAKNDFSKVFNTVYNELKPAIIKRRKDQEILMLRKDLLRDYLPAEFKVEIYREKDGTITLSMDTLEIAVNAPNMESALEELIKELIDYAKEYLERSQLFINSPNRKSHFPYVLRLMLCDSDDEIKALLKFSYAS